MAIPTELSSVISSGVVRPGNCTSDHVADFARARRRRDDRPLGERKQRVAGLVHGGPDTVDEVARYAPFRTKSISRWSGRGGAPPH